VENKYTSHKFILSAVSVAKVIKVNGSLTKLRQKQFCTVFLWHGVLAEEPPVWEVPHGGALEPADETDRLSARQSRKYSAQEEMGTN